MKKKLNFIWSVRQADRQAGRQADRLADRQTATT